MHHCPFGKRVLISRAASDTTTVATPLICQTLRYLAAACPSWGDDVRLIDATPVHWIHHVARIPQYPEGL
jgi:hypothetical protein